MRNKYKQWAVDYLVEHPEIILMKENLDSIFVGKPVCFEIGAGKGDFAIGMALKNPDKQFVAVEKVKTVAGIAAKKIQDLAVPNVLVYPCDIEELFESLKDESVDTLYLNFSDPWPKKRHAKRRLTYHTFLERYYRILKKGGELIFKSDNDSLYAFTLEEIQESKFKLISNDDNYQLLETDVPTEYELKFRAKGKNINRIVLRKE
ncbi:MAG: tRNA (guanosine(46)-N7)-methyltransferase TrmB [Bacilli bacterium]|nr:tRNA (guanosine(46)-N7)-methyltransferase TrmB [Bacilli bacterium]